MADTTTPVASQLHIIANNTVLGGHGPMETTKGGPMRPQADGSTMAQVESFDDLSDPSVVRHDALTPGADQNSDVDRNVGPVTGHTTTPGH